MSRIIRKSRGILSQLAEETTPTEEARVYNRMFLAAKIADALADKGISQVEFSKMMSRSKSEISDWLSGDRNFTVDTLSEIENVLNISLVNTFFSVPKVITVSVNTRWIGQSNLSWGTATNAYSNESKNVKSAI